MLLLSFIFLGMTLTYFTFCVQKNEFSFLGRIKLRVEDFLTALINRNKNKNIETLKH
jgi:hypothetical protein